MRQTWRKSWLFLLALAVAQVLHGQGIRFEPGTWEQAKSKAAREQKMLLLVVCADWLEVCTIMQESIFTEPEIGAAYDPYFVAWKLDAALLGEDLHFDGIRLLSIPEFIFFDAQGQPQYRESKFKDHDEMLSMAAAARDPSKQLSMLQTRFEHGALDTAWLPRYLIEREAAGYDVASPCRDYLAQLPPERLLETRNWMIANYGVQSIHDPSFVYVLNHKSDFVERFGEEIVHGFILKVYGNSLAAAVTQLDANELQACQDVAVTLLGPEKGKHVLMQNELAFYAAGQRWVEYVAHAETMFIYFEQGGLDHWGPSAAELAGTYNEAAWNICLHVTDTTALRLAAGWAQKSVAAEPAYWNYHTLGSLQLKLGQPDAARRSAMRAMQLAIPDTPESDEVQALLDLINKSR